ncbi:MAG: hypothetical protein Q9218_006892 [Villophora microphyllina]
MDRSQNNTQDDHSLRVPYGFNGPQNDSFNSFLNNDNDPSFNPSWDSQPFNSHAEPTNPYTQSGHGWHQNPASTTNYQQTPNFGVHSAIYDQRYSRSPAPFDYSGFNPNQDPAISGPPYDHSFTYAHPPLPTHDQYGLSRTHSYQQNQQQAQNQTISPQALQNYPAGFAQNHVQRLPLNQASIDPALASRKPSAYAVPPPQPITRQGWKALSSTMPDGKTQGNFLVKANAEFVTATKSKHLAGFTFVGNDTLEVSTTKATVPKYNRRRSRNEIRRLLLQEKGTGPWPPSREPLLKKLKISSKSSISRPPSAGSRGTSTVESPSTIESSSESDPEGDESEYDTSSELEVEPEEPSPLPPNRPLDPLKAIEYDTIKAVWAKRKVNLSGVVIRTALSEYWNIMKGVRDRWKAEMATLQQALEKKEKAKIIEYERRAANQRKLLESCIHLTLKHGHRDIVEKLGENPILSVIFYNFIADRFKESDYAGSLVTSIMELMARCVTIDQAMLERTKIDKVLPRIVKRGDEQGKAFAQKVLDNAAAVSKQTPLDSKSPPFSDSKDNVAKKPVTGSKAPTEVSSGARKPQISGEVGLQSLKKTASANAATSSVSAAANVRAGGLLSKKTSTTDNKAADKGSVPASAAAKIKTTSVAPKTTTSFFTSLQSASKKPGTSNAALKSTKPKEGDVSVAKVTDSATASQKPAFSFAETFANLSKTKESEPSKSEEERAPETPEERRKRLRKEDRRKLRVSFKPDDTLVSIRIFEHDPDEEMGHDDSMVRDANDIKGEGQMLKMHRERDMVDEDDDVEAAEETLRPWTAPICMSSFMISLPSAGSQIVVVDFSTLPTADINANFARRGGKNQPESVQKTIQEQRELNSLMMIYTSMSDIPPSPREPPEQESEDFAPEQSFGAWTKYEFVKFREAQYYAALNGQPTQQAAATPAPDISHLLSLLNSQQNQTPQPQAQMQHQQPTAPSNGLEAIFAQYSNSQQRPAQMQAQPVPQQAPASGFDFNAAMAAINQQTQQPQQTYNQQAQPAPTADLSSLLALIQPTAPTQGYGYGNTYHADNERKRPIDHDNQQNGDYSYNRGKRVKSGGDKKKPFNGIPYQVCRFWQEGKCRKGEECTYLHE